MFNEHCGVMYIEYMMLTRIQWNRFDDATTKHLNVTNAQYRSFSFWLGIDGDVELLKG